MSDYRAGRENVTQDREDRHLRIGCPTLALWGQDFELVGRMWDVEAIWREMASMLRTVPFPDAAICRTRSNLKRAMQRCSIS
jgi:haloacetate dehalogenase